MKIAKTQVISLFLLGFGTVYAQDSTVIARQDSFFEWGKNTYALHMCIGTERTAYSELGIALHSILQDNEHSVSRAFYLAVEKIPAFSFDKGRNIIGYKEGIELDYHPWHWTMQQEVKYQSNGLKNDYVFSLKSGFIIQRMIMLYAGYNLSFRGSPFPEAF